MKSRCPRVGSEEHSSGIATGRCCRSAETAVVGLSIEILLVADVCREGWGSVCDSHLAALTSWWRK